MGSRLLVLLAFPVPNRWQNTSGRSGGEISTFLVCSGFVTGLSIGFANNPLVLQRWIWAIVRWMLMEIPTVWRHLRWIPWDSFLEQFAIEILQKTEMQDFIFAKKKRNFMSTKMLGSVIIDHNWSNLVHQDFADFLGIIVGAELPIKLCRILEMGFHFQNPTKFYR